MPTEKNDPAQSEKAVRDYYDDNTNLFLKLGLSGTTRAIHQPLFLNGDESLDEALHAQHSLILDILLTTQKNKSGHILDLGCGVGSAIQFLAPLLPDSRFTGITLSPRQAAKAENWLRANHVRNAQIMTGSYQALPGSLPPVQLAYAIESFIHATEAPLFFSEVSDKLEKGAKLIIFDDVLAARPANHDPVIESFINGWKANSLLTIEDIAIMSAQTGLQIMETRDLTRYQHLWRLRDRWISSIQPLLPILPVTRKYRQFLKGGNARQQLFRNNQLKYVMLVFEKKGHA